MSSSRVLSLFLPSWSTDLVRRRSRSLRRAAPRRAPILLAVEERGRLVVARRCAEAARAGVAVGMGLAEARALLGGHQAATDTTIEQLDERRDAAALRSLATWAQRFAPIVALDPPDGLLLDVTGCAPVFRGERELAETLCRGIARMGVASRAAVADTAGCAWAVARHARFARFAQSDPAFAIVESGREREALSTLPVAALRVDERATETLEEVGVDRVEPLLALPRHEIAARFGAALLLRLDQALGLAPEALTPFRPRPVLRVERAFPGPVRSLEGVLLATRALLDDLVETLRGAAVGALALDVVLDRSDAPPVRLTRALSRRSSDARHLWALLRPAIERANLGFGVDRLEVTATRTGPCRPATSGLGNLGHGELGQTQFSNRDIAEMLDALAGRLGPTQIFRIEPVESHVPETAFRRVAVVGEDDAKVAAMGTTAAVTPNDRPSILYTPPEPAESEGGAPGCFRQSWPGTDWRDCPRRLRWRGEEHERADARGPERIAARWWEHVPTPFPDGVRDYFVWTSTRGRRLWLFFETASDRWFVHGEWA